MILVKLIYINSALFLIFCSFTFFELCPSNIAPKFSLQTQRTSMSHSWEFVIPIFKHCKLESTKHFQSMLLFSLIGTFKLLNNRIHFLNPILSSLLMFQNCCHWYKMWVYFTNPIHLRFKKWTKSTNLYTI